MSKKIWVVTYRDYEGNDDVEAYTTEEAAMKAVYDVRDGVIDELRQSGYEPHTEDFMDWVSVWTQGTNIYYDWKNYETELKGE